MVSSRDDSVAWNAHLAEGNATQARKRVAVDAVLRDSSDRILLVDPTYKSHWDLPGGMAEANEALLDAVRREVKEELRCAIQVGSLLCVDWVAPHGPWDDLLAFVFDGGVLPDYEVAGLRLLDGEIADARFCAHHEAPALLRPYVWRRVRAALDALQTGAPRYLQNGSSPG